MDKAKENKAKACALLWTVCAVLNAVCAALHAVGGEYALCALYVGIAVLNLVLAACWHRVLQKAKRDPEPWEAEKE